MSNEMFEQFRKNMEKTGKITSAEQRMMGAAIADVYDETKKVNDLLTELNKMICSNPVIVYGNWIHKQPFIALLVTGLVLVIIIATVDIIGVREAFNLLSVRIK